jgi:phosphoribosylanthranilate isomerase
VNLWVKICGLSTSESVDAAVRAGADAVGFVFRAGSPRNLTPHRAAELAAAVPSHVKVVAVSRHPTQALLDAVFAAFTPDYLQTDAGDLPALRLPVGVRTLPVLRSGSSLPQPLPETCLYEAAVSGGGVRADWDEAARLACDTHLVLAGGLDPMTVGAAVSRVRPFGVDVSSGVESAPGVKESEKIRAFVAAARAASMP